MTCRTIIVGVFWTRHGVRRWTEAVGRQLAAGWKFDVLDISGTWRIRCVAILRKKDNDPDPCE